MSLSDFVLKTVSSPEYKSRVYEAREDSLAALEASQKALEGHLDDLHGTQVSRLAWLLLNQQKIDKAKSVVMQGLHKYPKNNYLLSLLASMRDRHFELFE